MIPGSGRLHGNGVGYPLGSVGKKNLPTMWEIWVKSLDWEDTLGESIATHSSIHGLPWWLRW